VAGRGGEVSLEHCSWRVRPDLVLLCVNSHPKRDPRDHIIDHVYVATDFTGNPRADDDAASYEWIPLDKIPRKLAFDHRKDLNLYIEWRKENEK